MKKVLLSDSGPETSEAIYSFWRWEKNENLTLDRVKDILSYNLKLGINTFELSGHYANGKIEKLFGEALTSLQIKREELVIFSKIGIRFPQEDGSILFQELTEKSIQTQVESSLKNLGTSYIDVLLIEDFDPLVNIDVLASSLTSLQLRNKIKHVGVSGFNVQQHKLLASRLSTEIVTNHFELNLLNTKALNDGRLDFIKENYSKPMAFGPLADGRILNGKDTEALAIRAVLESLSDKYSSNIEQLAVAWIYKLGALPVIGSLSKERIKNAATANEIKLSHQDWHVIYDVVKQIKA